jgi:hypothetical protein
MSQSSPHDNQETCHTIDPATGNLWVTIPVEATTKPSH